LCGNAQRAAAGRGTTPTRGASAGFRSPAHILATVWRAGATESVVVCLGVLRVRSLAAQTPRLPPTNLLEDVLHR
jgi:hypothetical protein